MPPARLKTRYLEEIRPALMERFGYSTPMRAPRVEKVTVNMGVGDAKQDSKVLDAAAEQLGTITGQKPSVRRARKSIAQFKVREGMPVGVAVTLRGERSLEFLDRLMSVAIPRIRDFRGLSPTAFDGRGNYSLGVREQIIFPEVDYDEIDQVRGLDITITTSAQSDEEGYALLEAMGMPFARPARAAAPAPAAAPAAPPEAEAQEPVSEDAEPESAAEEDASDSEATAHDAEAPSEEPEAQPAEEAEASSEAEGDGAQTTETEE
jgi:large subunit ribosomal protein L5